MCSICQCDRADANDSVVLAPSRPSRAYRAVASRPALASLRASLPLPSVAMEISGQQLKTETISPCGFEKVLSNPSVNY